MASWFITSTCQLIPKTFPPVSDQMHDLPMAPNHAEKEYPQHGIMCGSTAEFYIRPLNSCIGDNDILVCQTNELAYSGDFLVLPSDMSGIGDIVLCYILEPCQRYPGFVRLQISGTMAYNWEHKNMNFIATVFRVYTCSQIWKPFQIYVLLVSGMSLKAGPQTSFMVQRLNLHQPQS